MEIADIIKFKKAYQERCIKNGKIKIVLTPHDVKRKDAWAERVLGTSELAFMFDVLVHNVDDALENGYWIAL